jgi:hypothetical protein
LGKYAVSGIERTLHHVLGNNGWRCSSWELFFGIAILVWVLDVCPVAMAGLIFLSVDLVFSQQKSVLCRDQSVISYLEQLSARSLPLIQSPWSLRSMKPHEGHEAS